MTTPNTGGSTGGNIATTIQSQQVQDYLSNLERNSTDFLTHFRDIVSRAKAASVSEQQLLDMVSQNYNKPWSGSSSSR